MESNGGCPHSWTVSDVEACTRFYRELMGLFEMALVFDDHDVKDP